MATLVDIGFESDLSELSSTVQNNGDITQSVAAALGGTSGGMSLALDGGATTDLYGVKTFTAVSSTDIRIRVYWDVNTFAMTNNTSHNFLELFENSTALLRSHLRFLWLTTPKFQIRCTLRNDAGTETHGSYATIGASWADYFEYHIHKSTNGTSNDAYAKLYMAGDMVTPISEVTGIDLFDNFGFDELRIGMMSGVDTTTTGTLYLDQIKVTDTATEIGEAASAPTNTVNAGPTFTSSLTGTAVSGLSVTAGTGTVTSITLSCPSGKGTWTVTESGDVVATGNGTNSVVLTGDDLTEKNTVLGTASFQGASGIHETITHTLLSTDGTLQDSDNFTTLNDVRKITVTGGTFAQKQAGLASAEAMLDAGVSSDIVTLEATDSDGTDSQNILLVVPVLDEEVDVPVGGGGGAHEHRFSYVQIG